jgi:hypothetical protein
VFFFLREYIFNRKFNSVFHFYLVWMFSQRRISKVSYPTFAGRSGIKCQRWHAPVTLKPCNIWKVARNRVQDT